MLMIKEGRNKHQIKVFVLMNNADDQREEKQTPSQGDGGTKVEKVLKSPKHGKYRL